MPVTHELTVDISEFDGDALEGIGVQIRLLTSSGEPLDYAAASDSEIVKGGLVASGSTDSNGEVTFDLIASDDMCPPTKYEALLDVPDGSRHRVEFKMGATDTNLAALIHAVVADDTEANPTGTATADLDRLKVREVIYSVKVGARIYIGGNSAYDAATATISTTVDGPHDFELGDAVLFQLPSNIDAATDALTLTVTHNNGAETVSELLLNFDLTNVIAAELVPSQILEAFYILNTQGQRRWVLIEPTHLTPTQAQDSTSDFFGLVSGELLRNAVQAHVAVRRTKTEHTGSSGVSMTADTVNSINLNSEIEAGSQIVCQLKGPNGTTTARFEADDLFAATEHFNTPTDNSDSLRQPVAHVSGSGLTGGGVGQFKLWNRPNNDDLYALLTDEDATLHVYSYKWEIIEP